MPECTQQKNGCSSHGSSAFSASATAAAHSLIWQHRTLGMNTDYWHLEWTPTLINTQLKVPLNAHPWAWLWPSQLSKDLQLQNTYQQHAPTTTPSITTKSMLRERLPSGIFLVWYMSEYSATACNSHTHIYTLQLHALTNYIHSVLYTLTYTQHTPPWPWPQWPAR